MTTTHEHAVISGEGFLLIARPGTRGPTNEVTGGRFFRDEWPLGWHRLADGFVFNEVRLHMVTSFPITVAEADDPRLQAEPTAFELTADTLMHDRRDSLLSVALPCKVALGFDSKDFRARVVAPEAEMIDLYTFRLKGHWELFTVGDDR